MRRILIIDDDELAAKPGSPAPEGPGIVRAYDHVEALVALRERSQWDEVWFDHDLGAGGDARKVLEFLEEQREAGYPIFIDAVYIHSMNGVGADELERGLRRMYPTRRVPLPWTRTQRGAPHAR
jgi:hypothetical protein